MQRLLGFRWRSLFPGGVALLAMVLFVFACSQSTSEPGRLIILLTDFGLQDSYVGTVKGVIYTIYPAARIDDIAHGIKPYDVRGGAYELLWAAREYPEGTIFVAVVDPGVGTERRALAVKTKNEQIFIAPDNGLLTYVVKAFGLVEARHITNPVFMRKGTVSGTFHGRDIFGPAAAHLAAGQAFESIGPVVTDFMQLAITEPRLEDGILYGDVVYVDQYGNLITNIDGTLMDQAGLRLGDSVQIKIGARETRAPFVKAYGDVAKGKLLCLVSSQNTLEVAINMRNLAQAMAVEAGAPVRVRVGRGSVRE